MIDGKILEKIYNTVKTPFKAGAVIKRAGELVDSPVVFKHGGRYYMSFVTIDEKLTRGYDTHVAESDDLVLWRDLGVAMKGGGKGWDAAQCGGYAQFQDAEFGGSNRLMTVGGEYIFGYIGGDKTGYETDPLSMGIARTPDFTDFSSYKKNAEPVLSPADADARYGETLSVFKPDMFFDAKKTLGHPYVMAYNARNLTGRESIFLAVSDDGLNWKRFSSDAVLSVFDDDDGIKIYGDPQIVVLDGLYVMFYFVFDSKTGRSYNTFAASEDLLGWTRWQGAPLMKSEFEWENVHAHKQWIIKEKGVVYHFYCAVNDRQERFICLATSEPLKK